MEITTKQILKFLHVLAWIIFIGLCVQAGGIICHAIISVAFNSESSTNIWQQADLSALYTYDKGHFLVIAFYMSLVIILQALMFYLIVKIMYNKKLSLAQPFNTEARRLVILLSYLALLIGLFSSWGTKYSKWLSAKGITMPDSAALELDGASVWLFMAVILFVIAQIFKRGIEIQSEHELTI